MRRWIYKLPLRLRSIFKKSRIERELSDELRFHLEKQVDEFVSKGMTAEEARCAALRELGGMEQIKEECRDMRQLNYLENFLRDLRYGMRTLWANRGFAATVVISLSLGIGANIAIFSVINAVLLRSLPVEDPHQLVQIKIGERGAFTNPLWEQVRDHQQSFSGVFSVAPDRFDLAEGGECRYSEGLWVSGDFFRVLGVPPFMGRIISKDDDRHGGGWQGPVAVISYSFWKQNYGCDPAILGKIIRLNRHPFEIVGVTPPWFTGLDVDRGYEVAIPLGCEPILHTDMSALEHRSWWWLQVVGRIAPGVNIQQAEDRLKVLAPEIFRATLPSDYSAQDRDEYLRHSFSLRSVSTGFSGTGDRYRNALFMLMAVVGIVLLVACANIANLLLARASVRQREISMRMSMGASRSRVIRQLLTESLLLSALGAAGGFLDRKSVV
jgi:predicted permease